MSMLVNIDSVMMQFQSRTVLLLAIIIAACMPCRAAQVWLRSLHQPPPYGGWEYTAATALEALNKGSFPSDMRLDQFSNGIFEFFHPIALTLKLPDEPVRLIWRSQGRTLMVVPTGRAFQVTDSDAEAIADGWYDVEAFEQFLSSNGELRAILKALNLVSDLEDREGWAALKWTAVHNISRERISLKVSDGRSVEVHPGGIVGLTTTSIAGVRVSVPVINSEGSLTVSWRRLRRDDAAEAQWVPHPPDRVREVHAVVVRNETPPEFHGPLPSEFRRGVAWGVGLAAASLAGFLAFEAVRRRKRPSVR